MFDEVEEAGEPVVELEGVGEQLLGGFEGDAQGGGQRGWRELVHQWCTGSGQGCTSGEEAVVVLPAGRVLIVAGVQQRPLDGEAELPTAASCSSLRASRTRSITSLEDEGDGGVHGETLGAGTDSFDSVSEDVDNFSHPV